MLHQQLFVRSILVHFINKQKHRDAIAFEQPPKSSCMSLYSVRTADHQYCIVQHLKSTLHLCRKIRMSRRIQQSYFLITKGEFRLFGKYCNSSGPFQLMGVEKCILIVHSS